MHTAIGSACFHIRSKVARVRDKIIAEVTYAHEVLFVKDI